MTTTTKRHAPTGATPQTVRVPFELRNLSTTRADTGEDLLRVEGHASVFDHEYEVFGGPPYGWIETINRGAFDDTLRDNPDVVFLRNHEGMPLARTKSGTLRLSVDQVGLFQVADLDLSNPEVQALESALRRGDVDEMSFAFRVTAQVWSEHRDHEGDEMSLREVMAINLNRGDVSAVTFGASDATTIKPVDLVQTLSANELVEVRDAIAARIGPPAPPVDLGVLRIPDNPVLLGLD